MPSLPRIKNTDSFSQRDRKINDALSSIEELGESTFTTVIPTSSQLMIIDAAGSIVNKGLGTHYNSTSPYQNFGDAGLQIPPDNFIVRSVTITNAGSSFVAIPTVSVSDPYTTTAFGAGTTYIQNNIVFVIGGDSKKRFYKATTAVASGGAAPSHLIGITSDWLFIGRTAQASATINAGQINTVTIDDTGFGYTGIPVMSLSGGGGSGAQLTPKMYSDITLFLTVNSISNKPNITSLTDTLRASDFILVYDEAENALKKITLGILTPNVPTGAILFGSPTDSYTWDATNLHWNDTNNRLGIGTNTPSYPLDIVGNVNAYGNYHIDATVVLTASQLGSGVINSSLQTLGTISSGVWNGTILAGQYGGTGVNNSGKTITVSGNVVLGSSAHTVALVTTADTSITLPVAGTLATLSGAETLTNKTIVANSNTITGIVNSNLSGAAGISNANLANSTIQLGWTIIPLGTTTATLSGLTSVTSTTFNGALSGNASSATILQTARTITLAGDVSSSPVAFDGSGNITLTAVVVASTFPNIQYAKNFLLAANSGLSLSSTIDPGTNAATFTIGVNAAIAGTGLTIGSGVLNVIGTTNRITANADSIDISTGYVGQSSITTLGTISSGAWNGTIIGPQFGGTGVNNSSRTISLGGNIVTANTLTTIGNFPISLTATGTTTVTLPTSGTLVTTSGAGATGTWGINISGTAATATSATSATTATNVAGGFVSATTGNFTGRLFLTGGVSSGTIANPSPVLGAIEIVSANSSNAAFMTFHVPNVFAGYLGIDTDGKFKVGGWSFGGNSFDLLHAGNIASFSPTLIGAGASGTWGISISGSARSITRIVASGTAESLVEGLMGGTDAFRILVGGTADAGYVEFAVGDNGNEPIYFRQYTGVVGNSFGSVARTVTLLDASGNTIFPGTVSTNGVFSGTLTGNASSATYATTAGSATSATNATTLLNHSIPQIFRPNVIGGLNVPILAQAGEIIEILRLFPGETNIHLPQNPPNGTAIRVISPPAAAETTYHALGLNRFRANGEITRTLSGSRIFYFYATGDGQWIES